MVSGLSCINYTIFQLFAEISIQIVYTYIIMSNIYFILFVVKYTQLIFFTIDHIYKAIGRMLNTIEDVIYVIDDIIFIEVIIQYKSRNQLNQEGAS